MVAGVAGAGRVGTRYRPVGRQVSDGCGQPVVVPLDAQCLLQSQGPGLDLFCRQVVQTVQFRQDAVALAGVEPGTSCP